MSVSKTARMLPGFFMICALVFGAWVSPLLSQGTEDVSARKISNSSGPARFSLGKIRVHGSPGPAQASQSERQTGGYAITKSEAEKWERGQLADQVPSVPYRPRHDVTVLDRASSAEKSTIGPAISKSSAMILRGDVPLNGVGSPVEALGVIKSEDFEGAWPNDWVCFANSGYADAYWGDNSYMSYNGFWSGYCADSGSESSPPSSGYIDDMNAWMAYGPFSLVGASSAEVSFYSWFITELNWDWVGCYASINGANFYGTAWSGNSGGWSSRSLDLTNVPTLGDVTGESAVWIAFIFTSDGSNTYDGAFLDDISITSDGVALPNLTAPYASWQSTSVNEGEPFWVRFEIDNEGPAAAGASNARFYLSPGDDWDTSDDQDMGTQPVAALASGATTEIQWDFSMPDMGSGCYDVYMLVDVDCFGEVDESDEGNLYKANASFTACDVSGAPDIYVTPTHIDIYESSGASSKGEPEIEDPLVCATGLIVPEEVRLYWETHAPKRDYNVSIFLSSVDWSGNDSPVKSQGSCGSCWAFAAIGLIENLGNKNDLSEQVIVSCAPGDCGGGWHWNALAYAHDSGVPPEECYPYTATDGNCANTCDDPAYLEKVTNYTPASGLWGENQTVDDLKAQLQTGPLCVAFRVPNDGTFQGSGYQGGIYDYDGGYLPWNDNAHAVLLVGYNDAEQYFLVKNSWGVNWGEDGYFRIAYDDVTDDVKFGSYGCTASGVYTEGGSSFEIQNLGDADLEVTSITDTQPWLEFSPTSVPTIPPGGSATITVSVNDWSSVDYPQETGYISLSSNDPDGANSGPVEVVAYPEPPPQCLVDPNTLSFSVSVVGGSDSEEFTITNVGGGTLSGSVAEGCPEFTVSSGTYNLEAGESRTFTVTYTPQDCGNDVCTVDTGTPCEVEGDVSCTASGPNQPVCLVDPVSLSFSVATIGASDSKTFTITNTNCGTLSGGVSWSCPEFSVVPSTYDLGRNQSKIFTVTYSPTDCGDDVCAVSTGSGCLAVSCTAAGPPCPTESIACVAPNGGETWCVGTAQSVEWVSQNYAGGIKIELSRDGLAGPWEVLAASTEDDGAETWTVLGRTSADCWIRVSDPTDGVPRDSSDAAFTIDGESITLIAPNGEEVWAVGENAVIAWATHPCISAVGITMSRNGAAGPWETLIPSTANDGNETWNVTGPASTSCLIRICDTNNGSPCDSSDSEFEIQSDTTCVGIPLVRGWTMASAPRIPDDSTAASLFPGMVLYGYSCASMQYTGADEVRTGRGYWVGNTGSDITIPICGQTLAGWSLSLCRGWEMIGSVASPLPASGLVDEPPGSIIPGTLYWYNPSVGSYVLVDSILPGNAYWLATLRACAVSVGAPQLPAAAAPGLGVGESAWHAAEELDWLLPLRVVAADREAGVCLYFGVGAGGSSELDPGLDVPLPPRAPVGSGIEAAFKTEDQCFPRLKQDVREVGRVLEWTVAVTSDVRFSLTWDSVELPEGLFIITIGNGLDPVDMRQAGCVNGLSAGDYSISVTHDPSASGVKGATGSDSEYGLWATAPNPARGAAWISYDVPRATALTLAVYDISGRLVATLVDGLVDQGSHHLAWDGTTDDGKEVTGGIYFCVMRAGEFRAVRRIVWIK